MLMQGAGMGRARGMQGGFKGGIFRASFLAKAGSISSAAFFPGRKLLQVRCPTLQQSKMPNRTSKSAELMDPAFQALKTGFPDFRLNKGSLFENEGRK